MWVLKPRQGKATGEAQPQWSPRKDKSSQGHKAGDPPSRRAVGMGGSGGKGVERGYATDTERQRPADQGQHTNIAMDDRNVHSSFVHKTYVPGCIGSQTDQILEHPQSLRENQENPKDASKSPAIQLKPTATCRMAAHLLLPGQPPPESNDAMAGVNAITFTAVGCVPAASAIWYRNSSGQEVQKEGKGEVMKGKVEGRAGSATTARVGCEGEGRWKWMEAGGPSGAWWRVQWRRLRTWRGKAEEREEAEEKVVVEEREEARWGRTWRGRVVKEAGVEVVVVVVVEAEVAAAVVVVVGLEEVGKVVEVEVEGVRDGRRTRGRLGLAEGKVGRWIRRRWRREGRMEEKEGKEVGKVVGWGYVWGGGYGGEGGMEEVRVAVVEQGEKVGGLGGYGGRGVGKGVEKGVGGGKGGVVSLKELPSSAQLSGTLKEKKSAQVLVWWWATRWATLRGMQSAKWGWKSVSM
ncbi:hypothetical protein CYMTET_13416 [Cymbomonas tetramitiformis]|uniref:Uncharacterized protein n=1 Tax=Cymbomonas tetramitiformis TaxID=36881 RepID=A0AAE0LBG6_9CHLO|nr:hypothetical protein CYMTET_13416 [Cymbomonas tetramitiformis]